MTTVEKKVLNVMREVIKKYNGKTLTPEMQWYVSDQIRIKLRMSFLPADEPAIRRFVAEYGSNEFPLTGKNICGICNHLDRSVKLRHVQGYETEKTRVCDRCAHKYKNYTKL